MFTKYLMHWLDQTTMYRVVLYALSLIAFSALTLSVAGVLSMSPLALLVSFVAVTVGATLAHGVCVFATKAPANIESSFITAFILFLIVTPVSTLTELGVLTVLGAAAIVLKYVVRYRLRHIFNPVALVLVLAALFGYIGAEWWVGSRYLLPVVLIAGIAVVMKTRRWPLVLTYVVVSTVTVVLAFWNLSPAYDTFVRHFLSWPTIFFAAFMLTEPLSLPSTKRLQYLYAALVALLSSIPFHLGPLYGTPELALLAANVMTLVVDRPVRARLSFLRKETVGNDTVEYTFASERPLSFVAGQYLEWTLPHAKPDLRGIRRYFTIASAPGTNEVSFAVRHMNNGSSFKRALASLAPGATMYATQRAGDFTLRNDAAPQVWIAGGIGITPFVSMIRAAIDRNESLNATLFYCNKTELDIAYEPLLAEAMEKGLKVVHVLMEPAASGRAHETGFITEAMLIKYDVAPASTTFYISGPPGLVVAYKKMLRTMKVSPRRIVTDYFPGLA